VAVCVRRLGGSGSSYHGKQIGGFLTHLAAGDLMSPFWASKRTCGPPDEISVLAKSGPRFTSRRPGRADYPHMPPRTSKSRSPPASRARSRAIPCYSWRH